MSRRMWGAAAMVLLAAGCNGCSGNGTTPSGTGDNAGSTTVTLTDSASQEAAVPTGDRVIAVVASQGRCPPVPGAGGRWEGKASSFPGLCKYEWQVPKNKVGKVKPAFDGFKGQTDVVRVEDDPQVASPLADSVPPLLGVTQDGRKLLIDQTQAVTSLPGQPAIVSIGVPDTSPAPRPPLGAGDIPLGDNAHGFNMAWIARYLSCPGGACASAVHTDLALASGGAAGTRSDVAESLRRLVDTYLPASGDAAARRLVLLLAWGWERDAECAPIRKGPGNTPVEDKLFPKGMVFPSVMCGQPAAPRDLSLPGKLVYQELARAVCRGALPIAAVGNDPGYSEIAQGAMLPAAWMGVSITSAQCQEWFGKAASTPEVRATYAVAGIDGAGCPAPLSRAATRTSLVVPAAQLAAYPETRTDSAYSVTCSLSGANPPPVCDRTTPKTGTSVAAAAVAGAAAAVWAYNQSFSAADVMGRLYDKAVETGDTADLQQCPTCTKVKRLALCNALAANVPGLNCPAAPPSGHPACPAPVALTTDPRGAVPPDELCVGQPIDPCPACVVAVLNTNNDFSLTGTIDQSTLYSTEKYQNPRLTITYLNGGTYTQVTYNGVLPTGAFATPVEWTTTSPPGISLPQHSGNAGTFYSATLAFTKVLTNGRTTTVTQGVTIDPL